MLNAIKVFISNIYFLFTNNMIMFVEASNMLTISFSNQLAEMDERISELEEVHQHTAKTLEDHSRSLQRLEERVEDIEEYNGKREDSQANEMNQLKLDVANSMQRYSSMVSKLRRDVDRLNELENINIRRHYEGGPENGI